MTVEPAPPATGARRTLGLVLVAAVVLGVLAGTWWWRTHRDGLEFRARFTSSVGVYPGSDVRVLGVPVGTVESVTPHGRYVTVAMELDPDRVVRADTYAVIISPNLVSDRYVQLTGAYDGGPRLRDGATIPLARTRTPVELDELARNLTSLTDALGPKGANATGSLARLLDVGAANLGGNGATLNGTIRRLSESGRTLGAARTDIFASIDRLARFTTTLKDHDAQLGSANRNLAAVSQTLSDDRETFGQALRELGTALALVQDFVRDNRAALRENVGRLRTVAGSLAAQRSSLAKALRTAPVLLQNFLNAYDPRTNTLRGRADLNELTVWASGGTSANTAATSSLTGSGAADAGGSGGTTPPAGLLPPNTSGGSR
ncbi:virulence factor Mce family protein [Jatrophihabitans endophyticus]|uniref:Virulence factor Mce family protein n=1 Tax=Jatrophihabitans endophyticus TaxID=1206085 RepID=A0A1M5ET73_9ACTN|nr:MCE family protein [Jatrophihabitans endophyticus]SHF82377.1 virulence factor Mce family protein [Jatrophihabitans endophyticus]